MVCAWLNEVCSTRKYILSKEATALITSEHLKMMVIPICLENSPRRGREAPVALGKDGRAPSGPRAPSPTSSVAGKVGKLTFQVVGFGNLDLELVFSMTEYQHVWGNPGPEGECSFGRVGGLGSVAAASGGLCCRDCFKVFYVHKFRAVLGKNRLIFPGEKVEYGVTSLWGP